MSERRRHPRTAFDREAVAYVGNDQAACRTLDVSVGGIALVTTTAHERGAFARVSWAFAPGQWVDADVVIVRVDQKANEFILGAAFLRIDTAVTSRIAELVLGTGSAHPPAASPVAAGPGPVIVPPPPLRHTPAPESHDLPAQRSTPTSYRDPLIRERPTSPAQQASRHPPTPSESALRPALTPSQLADRPTPTSDHPANRPTPRPSPPEMHPTPRQTQPAVRFTPQPSLPALKETRNPSQPVLRPSPAPGQQPPRTASQPARPSQAFRPQEPTFRPSEPGFKSPVRSSQPGAPPTFRPSQAGLRPSPVPGRQSPPPSHQRGQGSPSPIARDLISQIPKSKEDLKKLYEDAMREVEGTKPKKP